MQVSSRQLNKNIQKQIFAVLHQMLVDTRDPREVKTILDDLLSEAEHLVVAKRLAIAVFLDKGRSYENIKNTLKVSSATIASVQEMMGNPGMQLALQKVKAEEWAENWSQKIGSVLRLLSGKKVYSKV